MPILDGLNATQIIRKWDHSEAATSIQRRAAKLPIIAFTATTINRSKFHSDYPGMTNLLIKPVSMPQLYEALKPYASSHRMSVTNSAMKLPAASARVATPTECKEDNNAL